MQYQLQRLVLTIPFAYSLLHLHPDAGIERQKFIDQYVNVLEQAKRAAVDTEVQMTLIHLPVPHPPGIYNRATGEFSLDETRSYVDNLALADRTLGEIRVAMEQAGIWDETTVLVTSDHWWRSEMWKTQYNFLWSPEDNRASAGKHIDHRVPFILKLAGKNEASSFDLPFNTILSADLTLALLKQELHNSTDVAEWLSHQRTFADSPCNK